jgi:septal ring factor EnvC (AmiA/AmiB activator)
MEFSRVTSGFSDARFHPILQTWRAHKGVDFAAPTGTPVRATGNAKVAFVGRQEGYGNVIELQHSGGFSTLYAHLSQFGPQVRAGAASRRARSSATSGKRAGRPVRICTTSSAPAASSAIRSRSRCLAASR